MEFEACGFSQAGIFLPMTTLCCAFRLSDLQPCASTARQGSDVCHAHRNFYNKQTWLTLFASLRSPFILDCILTEPDTLIGRINHVVKYSLTSGKIVLTEEDVAALECPDPRDTMQSYYYLTLRPLYTVMVGTGKVDPRWNPNLLKHCFAYYARMSGWENRNNLLSLDKYIMPFFTYPGVRPHELLILLLVLHRAFMRRGRDVMNRRLAHECFSKEPLLLTCLYGLEEWKRVCYEKAAAVPTLNVEPLIALLEELIPQYRPAAKQLVEQRLGSLKEEVIAAGWHPDRFERWCLDEEEKKEHEEMFAEESQQN